MKNKSILTSLVAAAAMGACLIPILAQEPLLEQKPENSGSLFQDEAAQRELADLFVATQRSAAAPPSTAQVPGLPTAPRSLPATVNSQSPFAVSGPGQTAPTLMSSMFGRSAFDPELAKAINESNQAVGTLIKQLKETEGDSEKEAIKEKIKKQLDVQYDAYLQYHEQPLKQLEERLAKLREEFEARKKAKTDLVKLRLDTIWYDSLGLGWPSNRTTTPWRGGGLPGLSPYQNFQLPANPNLNYKVRPSAPGSPSVPIPSNQRPGSAR